MISSSRKRIIFCGNYRWYTPEWRHLDDPNNIDMDHVEFFGSKNMSLNVFPKEKKHLGKASDTIATNRMKMNRVIDSSEFVVRCNHGKTSNPTTEMDFEGKYPSSIYGNNTDILGITPSIEKTLLKGGDSTESVIPNHFSNMSVSMGVPDKKDKESYYKSVLKYYGSKMVTSRYDEFNKKEYWVNLGFFYRRLIPEYKKTNAKEWVNRLYGTMEYIQGVHGLNFKMLDLDSYYNLCSEVCDSSISYDELKDMVHHKKWAEPIFEFPKNPSDDWMKTECERSEWMNWVKSNLHVNRGLELIWMMMVDPRFNEYDKYIIGVMGINECHKIHNRCLINQWGEYLWMSKYIKEGKLKYLPEHVDVLYEEYEESALRTSTHLSVLK